MDWIMDSTKSIIITSVLMILWLCEKMSAFLEMHREVLGVK